MYVIMNHVEVIFVAKRTTFKILITSYYWPTLHKDVVNYTWKCDKCKRMGQPTGIDEMPLNPQMALTPFDKGGMDFIGPIDPPSNGKSYILVCIDYLTKWVEVKDMKHAHDEKVVEFLYEKIFTWYDVPKDLLIDQGAQFTSNLVSKLMK